jgi:hypothetical protein
MKVDPFAPRLLIECDLFCRRHGPYPFGEYMACWYAVQALIEAAENEGRDPFDVTPEEELALAFPQNLLN